MVMFDVVLPVSLLMLSALFFMLWLEARNQAKYWEKECDNIMATYKPYNDAWKKAFKRLKKQWDDYGVVYDKRGYVNGAERIFVKEDNGI